MRTILACMWMSGVLTAAVEPRVISGVLGTASPRSESISFESEKSFDLLVLVADPTDDGFSHDWAVWCDPVAEGEQGRIDLTTLKWASAKAEWQQVRVNQTCDGSGPIRVEGKEYKGLAAHAGSEIVFKLPFPCKRFAATVAVDDGGVLQSGARSSVKFKVYTSRPAQIAADGGIEPVPLDLFHVPDGLEVTLWAASPLLYNPTNMDIDPAGNIWVAEGRNYRGSRRGPGGDRIVVVKDLDGDGKADASHVFVQEKDMIAPLGLAVIGNQIVVSSSPSMVVYTDVNHNQIFEEGIDKRDVLLTGFDGANHDHSLHAVTVGPDGWWYWNHGNKGARFTDRSGREFLLGSPYSMKEIAGQPSSDGHVYIGGAAYRMRPDGTHVQVIGHNFRNSYEQTVTSYGDVFQNDNDDPPACRTTWLMEYGNLGFASADGKRSWGADRRPGEETPSAEWRQQDPGVLPAGDVYGGGAPTGIAFYENGALGKAWDGMLLTCESARNVVFGYLPKPQGAGFQLERFNFLTSNAEEEFAGADFKGGKPNADKRTLFRPSDVTVGPDGAVYVCDWLDPRVGGHQTLDPTTGGVIYRVAPPGFTPRIPRPDFRSAAGCLEGFKSPAIHTRAVAMEAFRALDPTGKAQVVDGLLVEEQPWIRARGIWLLPALGKTGLEKIQQVLGDSDPQVRIAGIRVMKRAGMNPVQLADRIKKDSSIAVRREAALLLRDVDAANALPILVDLASSYTGGDRWFLEALGTGATGKEDELYQALFTSRPDPLKWDLGMAEIAWRLHPPAAIPHLLTRALAPGLEPAQRQLSMDGLAFIPLEAAGEAMIRVATEGPEEGRKMAQWWVQHRDLNDWRPFKLASRLAQATPSPAPVAVVPSGPVKQIELPPPAEILKLAGNATRGHDLFVGKATCATCHKVGPEGRQIGPELSGIGKRFDRATLLDAILNPSAGIALGFEATVVQKKDGGSVVGFVIAEGDVVVVRDIAGNQHGIDAADIQSRTALPTSLMPPAAGLGISAQDLADILSFLQQN